MSVSLTEEGIIATGLQRQLDELREIIARIKSTPAQEQAIPSKDADAAKTSEEIQRLNIRISHLLRALDAKDAQIKDLESRL
ncbi:hypothetical protein LPJ73_000133 [Coemansia sp. RSA 2703]|nr:hypothetical protein LPJ73_000133 [Coemansia sp. RSA 2703]KAJ2377145.1 hypothetical protein IW150_001556 [Coemansia sp. RSA 2607]KAJ2397751.1 hypothetical protein GGI05_000478 [Coemansia sp. RSA 2603]